MLIQALHKLGRAAVTKEIDHDKSDNAPTTSVKNTTTRVGTLHSVIGMVQNSPFLCELG